MISLSRWRATPLFLLLVLGLFTGLIPAAAAQTASYGELTSTAINRIDKAVALIKSNDAAQAEELIKQTKESLALLLNRTQELQTIASQQHDRCVLNQGELEKRVNDLYTQREQEFAKIRVLQAELAEAGKRAQISQQDVARLQVELNATRESIRRTRENLEELSKWWWVPGYGQYLAIRTLANHDIENEDRLVRYLNEKQGQLRQSSADLQAAQMLMKNLRDNQRQTRKLIHDLRTMEAGNRHNLRQFKHSSVFLTDAETFWGKAGNSLDVNGSNFISTMEILQKRLAQRGTIPFPGEQQQSAATFREALLAFANSVDKKSSFLVNPDTAYCGGPGMP